MTVTGQVSCPPPGRNQWPLTPGCAATPAGCEAHHIIPWWQGGATCLANGVLLCPFHHRLVEPDPRQSEESQWQVHLDPATGMPWFTPPRHIDPARRPRQHQRHRLQQLTPLAGGPPCPPDPGLPDSVSPVVPERRAPDLDELIGRSSAVWASAG
ncbi:HNH endonuclease signature motif containing protein [Tessaracoccus sp. Y1736]